MHQTLYIDVDEEVISIIDRLKRSRARNNILIIPKHAIIFQSLVNLKLLKKEAKKAKRTFMIITPDKQGIMLAERLEIPAKSSLEGLEDSREIKEEIEPKIRESDLEEDEKEKKPEKKKEEEEVDLEIGTDNYFMHKSKSSEKIDVDSMEELKEQLEEHKEEQKNKGKGNREEILNKELIRIQKEQKGKGDNGKNKPMSDIVNVPSKNIASVSMTDSKDDHKIKMNKKGQLKKSEINLKDKKSRVREKLAFLEKEKTEETSSKIRNKLNSPIKKDVHLEKESGKELEKKYDDILSPEKGSKLSRFFKRKKKKEKFKDTKDEKNSEKELGAKVNLKSSKERGVYVNGKIKKFIGAFVVICIVVLTAVSSYLILPKAKVTIFLDSGHWKNELELRGNSEITEYNYDNLEIPVRIIEIEEELMESFDATGEKTGDTSSNQKARGMITIYNEYGSSSQPLVATTRFLSEDGKLFRLSKGVTVPGMTEVEGEKKPGAIEAEVVADKPGKDFNIDPTRFSIPGFEGGAKYEKFYATSETAMTGGGTSDDFDKAVSEEDIEMAKKEVEEKIIDSLKEKVKQEGLQGDEVLVEDGLKIEILESNSLSSKGVVTDSFDYKVKGKIKVLTFSETSVKKIIEELFEDKRDKASDIEIKLTFNDLSYTVPTIDLETGLADISVVSNSEIFPQIDEKQFKQDLLGKKEAEIQELIQNYPQIKEVEIEVWPSIFASRVPRKNERVELEINYRSEK